MPDTVVSVFTSLSHTRNPFCNHYFPLLLFCFLAGTHAPLVVWKDAEGGDRCSSCFR